MSYNHLPAVIRALPRVLRDVEAETRASIRGRARAHVAVDTGELRDSIEVTADGVEVGADHGSLVEFGTNDTAAQPFFLRAFVDERPAFESRARGIESRLRRAARV